MKAWLKNAVEVVLWYWLGRPTKKMKQRWADDRAKLPPYPKPGRTIL